MISERSTQKTESELQTPDQRLEDRAASIHFARPVGHRGGSLLCKGLFTTSTTALQEQIGRLANPKSLGSMPVNSDDKLTV